ncbi:hypothetical protein Hanom_Chr08g00735801 [Helianthus anomalus]
MGRDEDKGEREEKLGERERRNREREVADDGSIAGDDGDTCFWSNELHRFEFCSDVGSSLGSGLDSAHTGFSFGADSGPRQITVNGSESGSGQHRSNQSDSLFGSVFAPSSVKDGQS